MVIAGWWERSAHDVPGLAWPVLRVPFCSFTSTRGEQPGADVRGCDYNKAGGCTWGRSTQAGWSRVQRKVGGCERSWWVWMLCWAVSGSLGGCVAAQRALPPALCQCRSLQTLNNANASWGGGGSRHMLRPPHRSRPPPCCPLQLFHLQRLPFLATIQVTRPPTHARTHPPAHQLTTPVSGGPLYQLAAP